MRSRTGSAPIARTTATNSITSSRRSRDVNLHCPAAIDRVIGCVILVGRFQLRQLLKQFIGEYFKHFRGLLEDLINQGIDRGEFYPVNAAETAISFASMYEGLTIHWLMEPESVQWDILSENSIPMLLNGLKVKP